MADDTIGDSGPESWDISADVVPGIGPTSKSAADVERARLEKVSRQRIGALVVAFLAWRYL